MTKALAVAVVAAFFGLAPSAVGLPAFSASPKTGFRVFRLQNPRRVVVDVAH